MRALRPGALPTDTAIRFLLVLAAVTSATLYMFQSLWFVARGELFAAAVTQCSATGGEGLSGLIGTAAAQLRCQAPVSRELAAFQIGCSTLVLLVGWILYRAWPSARERRWHLAEPDPSDAGPLIAEVQALAASAGIHPVPVLRLDAANPSVTGYAYGAGERARLGLTGGLVVTQVLDPAGFRAIVRHELGHVANRDVPWTYYAMAVWWAFLGLAVAPVVVLFAFRDLNYLLRLGWRTAALAGLVALTIAALLRVRESYADARAAEWGSADSLDRLLASAPRRVSRRPAPLRTHPDPAQRRHLLADPDGLYAGSGWAVFAAGIAGSTALASLGNLASLVSSRWAVVIASGVVAPLLAAVVCTSAWRVGLREAVRGQRLPAVGPIGLGLGLGLALGPMLSFDAAVGQVADGLMGWLGYLTWAIVTVGVSMLVVRWAVDCARLRVQAALGEPAGPGRALLAHTLVMTAVFALWLATSAQALIILTLSGPVAVLYLPIWSHLPEFALGLGGAVWTLLAVSTLLVQPVRALQLAGRPAATWFWRDSVASDGEAATPAALTRPPGLAGVLAVGVGAGLVGGMTGFGVLAASALLDDSVRSSDTFLVALAGRVSLGVIAAGVCAGAAGAAVVPARWWPLGLIATGVAVLVCGAVAWVTLSAYRLGFLAVGSSSGRPLGWGGTRLFIVEPGLRSLLPAALAMAVVGSIRVTRQSGDLRAVQDPGRGGTRAALGVVAAGLAVSAWIGLPVLAILGLRLPAVSQPGYEAVVPPTWSAAVDPTTGSTRFVTVAEDVLVVIRPAASPGAEGLREVILVGAREAALVDVTQEGEVRWLTYELVDGADAYWVTVAGTGQAIAERQDELRQLLDAVRWHTEALADK